VRCAGHWMQDKFECRVVLQSFYDLPLMVEVFHRWIWIYRHLEEGAKDGVSRTTQCQYF